MTDHPGPDFLPYPLPAVTQPTVQLPPPPVAAPTTGRWSRALDGVPPLGVVAIGSGLGALVLLVLVSGIADQPGAGATVTIVAAAVSVLTGWVALRAAVAKDSKTLVLAAQSVGVLSALLAAMVYAAGGSTEQPVTPPSPAPSSSPSAGPAPTMAPGPVLPPGAVNGFGVPTDPGAPLTDDPTALGTLQGHVVDTAGKPIRSAVVTITRSTAGDTSSTPQCPTRVTTLTDDDGLYQLQLCQLGNGLGYHVRIQVGRSLVEHDPFVNSGNTTYYDVILPR
ncbi:MAG: hypothetical protein ABR549_13190 [Mycobacteriales bacterium]